MSGSGKEKKSQIGATECSENPNATCPLKKAGSKQDPQFQVQTVNPAQAKEVSDIIQGSGLVKNTEVGTVYCQGGVCTIGSPPTLEQMTAENDSTSTPPAVDYPISGDSDDSS